MLGQNPRKGVTHTRDEVAAELADVAFTALVAIASLDLNPHEALTACATKVRARFPGPETAPVSPAPPVSWPPIRHADADGAHG